MKLEEKIRDVPDFPIKGVLFKDITTLLKDPDAYHQTIDLMLERYRDRQVDIVVGMESRGFIFAAPLAYLLGPGWCPSASWGSSRRRQSARSTPWSTAPTPWRSTETLSSPGQQVLIVDDLLATGGTIGATIKLVETLGGQVAGIGFLIELTFLHGQGQAEGLRRLHAGPVLTETGIQRSWIYLSHGTSPRPWPLNPGS